MLGERIYRTLIYCPFEPPLGCQRIRAISRDHNDFGTRGVLHSLQNCLLSPSNAARNVSDLLFKFKEPYLFWVGVGRRCRPTPNASPQYPICYKNNQKRDDFGKEQRPKNSHWFLLRSWPWAISRPRVVSNQVSTVMLCETLWQTHNQAERSACSIVHATQWQS